MKKTITLTAIYRAYDYSVVDVRALQGTYTSERGRNRMLQNMCDKAAQVIAELGCYEADFVGEQRV